MKARNGPEGPPHDTPDDGSTGVLIDRLLAADALLAAGHVGRARQELAEALALLEAVQP